MNENFTAFFNDSEYTKNEKLLRERINEYNGKINIEEIKMIDFTKVFKQHKLGTYCGLIVKKVEIVKNCKLLNTGELYCFEKDGKIYVYKLFAYVYFSPLSVDTRSAFICQQIFPTLLDIAANFIDSPQYSLLNHPVFFINLVKGDSSMALSISRKVDGLIAMDINYIALVKTSNTFNRKFSLKNYCEKYFSGSYTSNRVYCTNEFEINLIEKKIKIRSKQLRVGGYLKMENGKVVFNGSSEKFFWMEIIPVIIAGIKENYLIDYKELSDFIRFNPDNMDITSKKMIRFKVLLDYIEKINI
jgi:hypothetical protein